MPSESPNTPVSRSKEFRFFISELIRYGLVGIGTTLINWGSFTYVLQPLINPNLNDKIVLITKAISWFLCTAFAFIANKIFVFKSRSFKKNIFWHECGEFFSARLVTLGFEELGMFLLATVFHLDKKMGIWSFDGQTVINVLLSVISIILNYFMAKFFIFGNRKKLGKVRK